MIKNLKIYKRIDNEFLMKLTAFVAVGTILSVKLNDEIKIQKIKNDIAPITYINMKYSDVALGELYYVVKNNRMEICIKSVSSDNIDIYRKVNNLEEIYATSNDDIVVESVVDYFALEIYDDKIDRDSLEYDAVEDAKNNYNDAQIINESILKRTLY